MKILITRETDNNYKKDASALNEHVHKKIRVSLYDDNKLELSYTTSGSSDYVGNIYVGHVENIVGNINAAFVRFKSDSPNVKDNIGYLDLKDIVPECILSRKSEDEPKLRNGDIVLVQVKKPAVKTKQVVLTTKLSISGRYAAITLGQKGTGCSKKLSEEKRKDIIAILKHDFSIRERISDTYGLIARTECEDLLDKKIENETCKPDHDKGVLNSNPFDVVRKEVDLLCDKIDEMLRIGATRSVATCLYETASDRDFSDKLHRCLEYYNLKQKSLKNHGAKCSNKSTPSKDDLAKSIDLETVTDDTELFSMYNASSFHADHPEVTGRLLSPKDGSINILYGLQTLLEKASLKKVWLSSGAYLVIESTEAMHVIDVNTGKAVDKKGNLFLDINIEAAIESARQIRLRNFSGMILIDFINMNDKKDYKLLENTLNNELSMDPVSSKFIDFTKLGIAEITRIKKD